MLKGSYANGVVMQSILRRAFELLSYGSDYALLRSRRDDLHERTVLNSRKQLTLV